MRDVTSSYQVAERLRAFTPLAEPTIVLNREQDTMAFAQLVCAVAMVLVVTSHTAARTCLHRSDESDGQQARREAATRYLAAFHAAQIRAQTVRGRFVALSELPGLPSVPVGFVPKFLHDQWSYVIILKDFFDPCGFALFSDDLGGVYEAHPSSSEPAKTGGDR